MEEFHVLRCLIFGSKDFSSVKLLDLAPNIFCTMILSEKTTGINFSTFWYFLLSPSSDSCIRKVKICLKHEILSKREEGKMGLHTKVTFGHRCCTDIDIINGCINSVGFKVYSQLRNVGVCIMKQDFLLYVFCFCAYFTWVNVGVRVWVCMFVNSMCVSKWQWQIDWDIGDHVVSLMVLCLL